MENYYDLINLWIFNKNIIFSIKEIINQDIELSKFENMNINSINSN